MTLWKEIAIYCQKNFNSTINEKEKFFECPQCGKNIYEKDWSNRNGFLCPHCHMDFISISNYVNMFYAATVELFSSSRVSLISEKKDKNIIAGFTCPNCGNELYKKDWSIDSTDNWFKCPICNKPFFAEK